MRQDGKAQIVRRDLLRGLGISASAVVTPAALVAEAKAEDRKLHPPRPRRPSV